MSEALGVSAVTRGPPVHSRPWRTRERKTHSEQLGCLRPLATSPTILSRWLVRFAPADKAPAAENETESHETESLTGLRLDLV
eukprot:scaffold103100_cov57-Phaeocystis_antarctica.AAC.3